MYICSCASATLDEKNLSDVLQFTCFPLARNLRQLLRETRTLEVLLEGAESRVDKFTN